MRPHCEEVDFMSTYVESYWRHLDWGHISQGFETFNIKGKVAPLLQ